MTNVFLTGITGLVGRAFVVSLLKERDDVKIVCLVRKSPVKSAYDRVREIIQDQCDFDSCPEVFEKVMKNVDVIDGDVTTVNPAELAARPELKDIDVVFHCAADVNLGKDPTGKTFKINYTGTENIVALAKLLKVKAIHYVSTAYVAGRLVGRAMEDVPVAAGFNNPYEESKCKAEMLVRNCGIPYTIYRPAIITGRLCDGKVRKPLAFYRIVEFLAKLKSNIASKNGLSPEDKFDLNVHFNVMPSKHVYFVPIDYVQMAITRLFQLPVENKTYHLTGDSPVSCMQIDKALCSLLNLPEIEISETEGSNEKTKLLERFIGDLFPYFSAEIIFDQTNVRAALGDQALDWEFGQKGLEVMMEAFLRDFMPNVDWIQRTLDKRQQTLAKAE